MTEESEGLQKFCVFGREFSLTQNQVEKLSQELVSWKVLNQSIMRYSLNALLAAIHLERQGHNRASILNRLYSRYTKVRMRWEKLEMFSPTEGAEE